MQMIRTKGIVLRKYHGSDNGDAMFLVYTKELGKIRVNAKGIKKINSKLAGHLASFGVVEFNLAGKREIKQLIGAVLMDKLETKTAEDFAIVSFVQNFLDEVVVKTEADPRFWSALEILLQKIFSNLSFAQKRLLIYSFVLQTLKYLGNFSEFSSSKYFLHGLNPSTPLSAGTKFVQPILEKQAQLQVAEKELPLISSGLKQLLEDVLEKEIRVWI